MKTMTKTKARKILQEAKESLEREEIPANFFGYLSEEKLKELSEVYPYVLEAHRINHQCSAYLYLNYDWEDKNGFILEEDVAVKISKDVIEFLARRGYEDEES